MWLKYLLITYVAHAFLSLFAFNFFYLAFSKEIMRDDHWTNYTSLGPFKFVEERVKLSFGKYLLMFVPLLHYIPFHTVNLWICEYFNVNKSYAWRLTLLAPIFYPVLFIRMKWRVYDE